HRQGCARDRDEPVSAAQRPRASQGRRSVGPHVRRPERARRRIDGDAVFRRDVDGELVGPRQRAVRRLRAVARGLARVRSQPDVPGGGALRLGLVGDGGMMFRVRARTHNEVDTTAPAAPKSIEVADVKSGSATLSFIAPGDDDFAGKVKSYEVRYRVGEPITEA